MVFKYFTPAMVTRGQPSLRDANHGSETTAMVTKNRGYLTKPRLRDVNHGYESLKFRKYIILNSAYTMG